MTKQDEVTERLNAEGWLHYQPDSPEGWKFRFKRDPDPEAVDQLFGVAWIYCTIFPNGDTADRIVETSYERWGRFRREIISRDFRDYPRGKKWRGNNVG